MIVSNNLSLRRRYNMKRHDPRRRSLKELQLQADKEYWKAEKSVSKINPIFTGRPWVAVLDGIKEEKK